MGVIQGNIFVPAEDTEMVQDMIPGIKEEETEAM